MGSAAVLSANIKSQQTQSGKGGNQVNGKNNGFMGDALPVPPFICKGPGGVVENTKREGEPTKNTNLSGA